MTVKKPEATVFHQILFNEASQTVYAILDGALTPNVAHHLQQYQADYACLYRGELEPDMAAVAPYLVALEPESALTYWVLDNMGENRSIFMNTDATLKQLHRHFRTFLMIYDQKGQPVYFRFYDPRVLRKILPVSDAEKKQMLFGPVLTYYAEDKTGNNLLSFTLDS